MILMCATPCGMPPAGRTDNDIRQQTTACPFLSLYASIRPIWCIYLTTACDQWKRHPDTSTLLPSTGCAAAVEVGNDFVGYTAVYFWVTRQEYQSSLLEVTLNAWCNSAKVVGHAFHGNFLPHCEFHQLPLRKCTSKEVHTSWARGKI